MTIALAEPVRVGSQDWPARRLQEPIVPNPKPDQYYSPGRIRHALSHWWCELDLGLLPGACNNDPYKPEQRTRGADRDGQAYQAADIRIDLGRGLRHLSTPVVLGGLGKPWLREIVEALRDLGPRSWDDDREAWKQRRIEWFGLHRYRFGNREGETVFSLSQYGTRRMAYFLGWVRPPNEEKK